MDTRGLKDLTASDLMSPDVVTVPEMMTVVEVVALMRDHDISGAPVVNAEEKPIGVVSLTDIALYASKAWAVAPDHSNPEFYVHGWEDKLNPDELRQLHVEDEGVLVRDVMTPVLYVVSMDSPLTEVARTMVEGHLHRLLVMQGGKLAGIVSSLDLLKAIAERVERSGGDVPLATAEGKSRTEAKTDPPPEWHTCAVCGHQRAHGGLLEAAKTGKAATMWVCEDCRRRLERGVDDEGTRGG